MIYLTSNFMISWISLDVCKLNQPLMAIKKNLKINQFIYIITTCFYSMDTKHLYPSINLTWGGNLVIMSGKVCLLPIPLRTKDFLVYHIHVFTIHGVLLPCGSQLSFDTG